MLSQDPLIARDQLENVEQWVIDYLLHKGCKILPNGTVERSNRREHNSAILQELFIQYDLEYKRVNRRFVKRDDKVDPARKNILEASFEKQINDWWGHWLRMKNEALMARELPGNLNELRKFVTACTGKCNELDLHVLAHWIWQVKRKMCGAEVSNHVMIVFTGKQGSGKSTAVSLLTKPLQDYRVDLNLESLADERYYHGLSRNFVCVCDEMQGCTKTDIEILKRVITANSLSARKLYTNSIDSLPQNVSFLGTSNKSLDVLIKDETGMRRFFEFKCLGKMDWSSIDSIDCEAIWKEIEERNPHGYLGGVMDALKDEQEKLRYRDSAELYIDDTAGLGGTLGNRKTIDEVFRDYVVWCEDAAQRPFDKGYFSKRLRALGASDWRSQSARGVELAWRQISILARLKGPPPSCSAR